MTYTVFDAEGLRFQPPRAGDQPRRIAGLSEAMTQMRANVGPPPERGQADFFEDAVP